jgi:hypothetical protein
MIKSAIALDHGDDEAVFDLISDEQLEAAAGFAGPGHRTWDMTSCSYCSISVC